MEAAAECKPSKLIAKYSDSWESMAVREKRDNMRKHPYLIKETQQTPTCRKFKKSRRELTKIYKKEQLDQGQINKIRNYVEN